MFSAEFVRILWFALYCREMLLRADDSPCGVAYNTSALEYRFSASDIKHAFLLDSYEAKRNNISGSARILTLITTSVIDQGTWYPFCGYYEQAMNV